MLNSIWNPMEDRKSYLYMILLNSYECWEKWVDIPIFSNSNELIFLIKVSNWKVICKKNNHKPEHMVYTQKRWWLRKQLCRIWLLIVGCRRSSSSNSSIIIVRSGRFHKMNNFLALVIASCSSLVCYTTYSYSWYCATSKVVMSYWTFKHIQSNI